VFSDEKQEILDDSDDEEKNQQPDQQNKPEEKPEEQKGSQRGSSRQAEGDSVSQSDQSDILLTENSQQFEDAIGGFEKMNNIRLHEENLDESLEDLVGDIQSIVNKKFL